MIGMLYTAGMASITPNTFFDLELYKAYLFDKHNITFHLSNLLFVDEIAQ